MPDIKVSTKWNNISIHINGLLHLNIERPAAIQSWKFKSHNKFYIEYTLSNGTTVTSDYDNRETWESILKQLESVL